jgi:hypothetical protein
MWPAAAEFGEDGRLPTLCRGLLEGCHSPAGPYAHARLRCTLVCSRLESY